MSANEIELHPEESEKLSEKRPRVFGRMLPSEEDFPGETSDETIPDDPIHHPKHYTAYKGLEVIQLTEQMNFNKGNAVKYVTRAGIKNPYTEIEDLEKAKWYIQREIDRIKDNS